MALAFGMANLAIAPVVNAKLYRHFAAMTVAITLCVALFANGEARQVVGDELSQEREATRLSAANTKKFGAKQIGDRRSGIGTRGGFGSDYDPSYGAGTISGGSRLSTYSRADPDYATGGRGPAEPPEVLSPDQVATLSVEEQAAYVKRLRNQGAPQREEEVHDLASIEAGSRARSGSTHGD